MPTPASVRSPRATRRQRRRVATLTSVAAMGAGVALLLPAVSAGAAPPPVGLGTARSFAVLAGSGITNTGPTTITGDIGTFPTPTMTNLGSMTINGTNYAGGTVTQQAKTDLTTAYNEARDALPPIAANTELGGLTLTPGIYNAGTLAITGTLTLDTLGDPNAVFIFQTPSTLITATDSNVVVLNGALACNVFWQVGSSATLGVRSGLIGTVLAATSITATTQATVQGRLLAQTGAVTLDTNTISNAGCATLPETTTSTAGSGGATTATTPADSAGETVTTQGPGGPSEGTDSTVPDVLSGPPAIEVPDTPGLNTTTTTTPGSTSSTSSTTTGSTTTSTTGRERPPLPFTGSDRRLPLAGAFSLVVGVLMLGLSRRLSVVR